MSQNSNSIYKHVFIFKSLTFVCIAVINDPLLSIQMSDPFRTSVRVSEYLGAFLSKILFLWPGHKVSFRSPSRADSRLWRIVVKIRSVLGSSQGIHISKLVGWLKFQISALLSGQKFLMPEFIFSSLNKKARRLTVVSL